MAKPPKGKVRDLAEKMSERELQTTLRMEEDKLRALLDKADDDEIDADEAVEADEAQDEFQSDGGSISEALQRATGTLQAVRGTPTARARPVTPTSAAPVSPTTHEEMLRWAKRMERDGAEDPALAICERILASDPDNEEANEIAERLRESLSQIAERRIGNLDRMPKLLIEMPKLQDRNLDPRTRLLLSQIDGQTTYRQLLTFPGMSRNDRLRALAQLLREGLIGTIDDGQG